MEENSLPIVSKVWSMCDTLRDDGVGYGDYLEQLTFLLFLKIAHEYSKPPYDKKLDIPAGYDWDSLSNKKGAELESHYHEVLKKLAGQKGLLGEIFIKSQNKIHDPAKLLRIINMINGESWIEMGRDVPGDIYEGLLQKNAEDTKSGAGQYFTPRPLIKAIVECIRPEPNKTITDPSCGTGGFFLAAYNFLTDNYTMDSDERKFLKNSTFTGWEIVTSTHRLCLMNMFLHQIGDIAGEAPIIRNDALAVDPGLRFDYVLSNPPFGKKSSITFTNEKGEEKKESLTYSREDFWTTTSNKQLNFIQHIRTLLKADGKAAVVVPDNVLFEAGVGETVRKKLLETTELHTILRLPTGIFYKQGVKANVIFFDSKPASKDVCTKEVWVYDFRTNIHFTLKKNPLQYKDLEDFIKCYNPKNRFDRKESWSEENSDGRWRRFTYDEIASRDKTNLDIFWLRDESLTDLDNLPAPDELAGEIIENLEAGLNSFREIVEELEG